MHPSRFKIL